MSGPELPPVQGLSAYQRGRIYARDLAHSRPPAVPQPGIAVRFAGVTTAAASALAAAMDQSTEHVLDSLRHNRRCFVAWRGDEIAAYCWISLQHEYVGEMERLLNILEGEAYVWNCATLPAYRRQGLYTALLAYILARLADDGLQRVWIGADLENLPSHRAFHTVGFLPAAAFTYLRLWRLYGFLTTSLPATPPLLLPAARRLFRLDTLPALGPLSAGWRFPT